MGELNQSFRRGFDGKRDSVAERPMVATAITGKRRTNVRSPEDDTYGVDEERRCSDGKSVGTHRETMGSELTLVNDPEMERVLLIADGDNLTMGTPIVEGAKVIATAQSEGKGKKVTVLKYKPKVRYTRKTGHRQPYTRLAIEEILAPGMTAKAEKKPARKRTPRAKKEVKEDGA